jgi:hypothetical protein
MPLAVVMTSCVILLLAMATTKMALSMLDGGAGKGSRSGSNRRSLSDSGDGGNSNGNATASIANGSMAASVAGATPSNNQSTIRSRLVVTHRNSSHTKNIYIYIRDLLQEQIFPDAV